MKSSLSIRCHLQLFENISVCVKCTNTFQHNFTKTVIIFIYCQTLQLFKASDVKVDS